MLSVWSQCQLDKLCCIDSPLVNKGKAVTEEGSVFRPLPTVFSATTEITTIPLICVS